MKTILMDVDGVAGDFLGHLLKWLNYYRKPGEKLPYKKDVINWRIEDFLTPDQSVTMRRICLQKDFWLSIPVIKPAQWFVREVRQLLDVEIVWVTSPWEPFEEWEYCRKLWLKSNFNADSKYIYPVKDKSRIKGDLIIDDRAENVVSWVCEHLYERSAGIIISAPYNEEEWKNKECLPALPIQRVGWDKKERVLQVTKKLLNIW